MHIRSWWLYHKYYENIIYVDSASGVDQGYTMVDESDIEVVRGFDVGY